MAKAKRLKRLPDIISIDGPPNKEDLPKGTRIKQTPGGSYEGYYPKKYLQFLNNARTGAGIEGRNASRIEKIYRTMGGGMGGMGGMFSPKNK